MKKIEIALLGLGTVGSGVKKIMEEKQKCLSQKLLEKTGSKKSIEITKILVRDRNKNYGIDKSLLTENYQEILEDESIKIVVEALGGEQPATEYMLEAMKYKKNVVSANKLAIAKSSGGLERTAKQNNVQFMYEASVAGAIPVLRVINDSLVANTITKLSGIINGTTNYILSKMTNENRTFEEALIQAQALGFAEAEPSSDIDGDDAVYKIAILSRLVFGEWIDLSTIDKKGITQITNADIQEAKNNSKKIKFIAQSEKVGKKIIVSVSPQEIDEKHLLSNVDDAMNAVYINCDNAGELLLQGVGAGSRPTASAVVSDIFAISQNL